VVVFVVGFAVVVVVVVVVVGFAVVVLVVFVVVGFAVVVVVVVVVVGFAVVVVTSGVVAGAVPQYKVTSSICILSPPFHLKNVKVFCSISVISIGNVKVLPFKSFALYD